jgi:hypothetical protein
MVLTGLCVSCSSTPPTSVARALCDYYAACDVTSLYALGADASSCATQLNAQWAHDFALPGMSQAATQEAACVNALDTSTCNFGAVAACEIGLHGDAPDGSACEIDGQCLGYCAREVTQPCGTCVTRAGLGETCAGSVPCQRPYQCLFGTCAGPSAIGAPCDQSGTAAAPCVDGASCVDGVCRALAHAGESCGLPPAGRCDQVTQCNPSTAICDSFGAVGTPCDSAECDPRLRGTWCDIAMKMCTPLPITVAQLGEPCGVAFAPDSVAVPNDSESVCAQGFICTQAEGATMQTCVAPLAAGASCAAMPSACAYGLACVNGTCASPSCTSDAGS